MHANTPHVHTYAVHMHGKAQETCVGSPEVSKPGLLTSVHGHDVSLDDDADHDAQERTPPC